MDWSIDVSKIESTQIVVVKSNDSSHDFVSCLRFFFFQEILFIFIFSFKGKKNCYISSLRFMQTT